MNVEQFLQLGETYPWLYPVIIILATFILEDPTTIAVGILISSEKLSYELGLSSLIAGVFLGDLGLYGLGLLIKKGIWKSKRSYIEPGTFSIGLARFVPGMRTVTFLSAGFSVFPVTKFLAIIFPSAIIWTVLILQFTKEIMSAFDSAPPLAIWIGGTSLLIGIQYIEKRFRK